MPSHSMISSLKKINAIAQTAVLVAQSPLTLLCQYVHFSDWQYEFIC
ncbi:MAG: hypothetical protein KME30_01770 [Iphinoe sp. HA4291-MV1]|nr:hypothetical protein [Iphinoe sp. HA4291-MV1]